MIYIKEFLNFLLKPENCKNIGKEYRLFFTYVLFFGVLQSILYNVVALCFDETNLFVLKNRSSDLFTVLFFFKALVLAPVFEEVMFRLIFKPKRVYFIVFLLPLLGLFLNWYIFIFVLIVIVFLLFSIKTKYEYVVCLFSKNFTWLVYLSSFIFGFMHVINYEIEYSFSYLSLAFVFFLPKIIAGLSLVFIRIKFGFIYAILTHSFFNLLPMVTYFLVTLLG